MTLREVLNADWDRLESLSSEHPRSRALFSLFNPRFAPIWLLRTAQALHAHGWRRAAKPFSLLNVVFFGLEVPARLTRAGSVVRRISVSRAKSIVQMSTFHGKPGGAAVLDTATRVSSQLRSRVL